MKDAKTFNGVGVIHHGDVFVMLWRFGPRLDQTNWVFDRVEEFTREHAGGILVLQLIMPTASLPDGPTRAQNHKRIKEMSRQPRRIVTVPLGDAVWLSLVRTTMRGMAWISGIAKTQMVADTEAKGLDSLLESAGPETPSRRELVGRIQELYRALDVPRTDAAIA